MEKNEFQELHPYMQNRELSWLKFNRRVLEESRLDTTPDLEKLKFISIFESNLTEFFMIRVGSLSDMSLLNKKIIDSKSGMNAKQQLNEIFSVLPEMYKERDESYFGLMNKLRDHNVVALKFEELSRSQLKEVDSYYQNFIFPILSPQIIDPHHPFPFLENNLLYILIKLGGKKKAKLGIIPINRAIPEYLVLSDDNSEFKYILTQDIIYNYAETVFKSMVPLDKFIIRVTRNADINLEPKERDEDEDFGHSVAKILKKRNRLAPVRLETNKLMSEDVLQYLTKSLKISTKQVFVCESPIKLSYIFSILDKISFQIKSRYTYQPYKPRLNPIFEPKGSIIDRLKNKEVLLNYPYEDMDGFLNLINEASQDSRVVSIKITIYRLAKNSKLVKYLCNAAENGKEVTTLLELRARFDEENNINYSHILYESGCNVFYGVDRYKVHSKLCLITYRDGSEIKYITQIGTGNYNESTSKLYTDFSFITTSDGIGRDANDFFRNILTGNIEGKYKHILQAPTTLKSTFLKLMDDEIAKKDKGFILLKLNSITDVDIVEKFKEASQAGVTVFIVVRGICCILPFVEGYTDNIRIRSIVGRYLEHDRIYCFGDPSDIPNMKVFISSADLMTRNMMKRVEVATPIYSNTLKERLVHYIKVQLNDDINGRRIANNGDYVTEKSRLVDSLVLDDINTSSHDYFMNQYIYGDGSSNLNSDSECAVTIVESPILTPEEVSYYEHGDPENDSDNYDDFIEDFLGGFDIADDSDNLDDDDDDDDDDDLDDIDIDGILDDYDNYDFESDSDSESECDNETESEVKSELDVTPALQQQSKPKLEPKSELKLEQQTAPVAEQAPHTHVGVLKSEKANPIRHHAIPSANVYDFDETIYDGDSTVDFYFFLLKKRPQIALYLPYQFINSLGFAAKVMEKTIFKERFYKCFRLVDNIDALVIEFWRLNKHKIKDFYKAQKKDSDIIISASPEFLLAPICKELGINNLQASCVNKKTGKYDGKNCYGEEKVQRFRKAYGDTQIDVFYSDSYSDEPLAKLAKKAFIVKGDKISEWKFTKK